MQASTQANRGVAKNVPGLDDIAAAMNSYFVVYFGRVAGSVYFVEFRVGVSLLLWW